MSKSFYVPVSVITVLMLSVSANGSTIYQTTADGSGASSLTNWDASSGSPKGEPTSGNDYVSEKTVRTPKSGNVVFQGNSLRMGTVGGTGGSFIFCGSAGGTYTFGNDGLVLDKGLIQPYVSKQKHYLKGSVSVTAPNSDPFVLLPAQGGNIDNYIYLSAKIEGAAESGFRVANRGSSSSNARFYLVPASGSNFAGTLTVGPGTDGETYFNNNDKHPIYFEIQGNSVVWPGTIAVTSYGQLVPEKSATKWTIGTLKLDAGSTLKTQLDEQTTSTMTLTDSLTTAYPVNLTFPSARTVNMSKVYIWDVLTLPKEKSAMIHPEHFVLTTQETVGMFPDTFPSVELRVTEKNELAVLELVQRQVVQNRFADSPLGYSSKDQGFEFPTSLTNALAWTNDDLPSNDIDCIAAYNLNAAPVSLCDEDGAYVFPGASLTLSNNVVFSEAARCFTIPMLRLMEDSQFWPIADPWEGKTAEVQGRIHVIVGGGTSADRAALIRVRENTTVRICSEITGPGRIQVQPNGADKEGCRVVFDNDNSKFLGRIRITANNASVSDFKYGETLVLKAADNLGGAPDVFTADAFEIRRYSTLEVTNDVVFATANRGMTVNNARIKVGAGATFTFNNDITYAGPLVKAGAGRLVLGGSALGSKKTLTVAEGTLAVSKDAALDDVTVTFAGGALAVNLATAGEYGVKGPFSGNLPVVFDLPTDEETHDCSDVAVCTVDASASVSPKAVRIPRHRVVFTWRDNGDDTKTLLADISRTGCAIILR